MKKEKDQIQSDFHQHPLNITNITSHCNICWHYFQKENHYFCSQCNFHICQKCLSEQTRCSQIKKPLIISYYNIKESLDMINFIDQRSDIQFTSPKMSATITRSYPTFTLYEEQERNQQYLITATRYFTIKGHNYYFFSSSQARKMIPICKLSADTYFETHESSLKIHRKYPYLKSLIDNSNNNADGIFRNASSYGSFVATLGIGYLIEKFAFTPQMCNAFAGYQFLNSLILASEHPFYGTATLLTKNFHLSLQDDQLLVLRDFKYGPFNVKTADHCIKIDWSTIDSIPIIISVSNEIKKIYQNTLEEGDEVKLNILFSLADYIDEGVSLMKQNPLFSNPRDKRLITFAESSIKSVQIFLRLKSMPLTILNTTVLNVYQADLGKKFHAFLSSDQFKGILVYLLHDLREELTSLSEFGEVVEIDLNNPKPVFIILNNYIAEAEAKLAKFIEEVSNKILGYCKTIKNTFASLTLSHFKNIKSFVFDNLASQVKHLKEITEFNQSHKKDLEKLIKETIKKKIIPDFYSIQLSKMASKVSKLKHLVELVKLACEIERRKNDNIGFFNIDLSIENCEECVHKYNIHIII